MDCREEKDNHWDIYLMAVKNGNTARFNDSWLEKDIIQKTKNGVENINILKYMIIRKENH